MAHLIDSTAGMDAIAYRGETPWHGLGQQMQGGESLETWRTRAGLNWSAVTSRALFREQEPGIDADLQPLREVAGQCVLYRDDTKAPLSIVSDRYRVVQPADIVDFYRDLTESHGYRMETLGAIKDGRVIWALARTGDRASIGGVDPINGFLLLSTSFDGSMATTGRFTSVRVVCNNTLTLAHGHDRADLSIPHSSLFNADAAKIKLGVGDAFTKFTDEAELMAEKTVTQRQAIEYFLAVYHDMTADQIVDKQAERTTDKTIARLAQHFIAGPGAQLATAKNTAWGLLNAITHDVDYSTRARTADSRLASAWYGDGARLKDKARILALEL